MKAIPVLGAGRSISGALSDVRLWGRILSGGLWKYATIVVVTTVWITTGPCELSKGFAAIAVPDSGISGQVKIRPVRPHSTIGAPDLAPYRATIDVVDANRGTSFNVQTDENGNFRIALPPGRYIFRPLSSGPYPRATEQMVSVVAGHYAAITIIYDSGIR